jgi:glycosyltransferase involved in cell wall biosynthesis
MRVRNLSVFFPAFDEETCLDTRVQRALDVLRDLDLERFEVLVVDDGSTDRSPEIADALAAAHPEVRVRHVRRPLALAAGQPSWLRGLSE